MFRQEHCSLLPCHLCTPYYMILHVPAPVLVFLFSHNLPFSATASVCVPYMRFLDLDATLVWSTGEA